MKRFFKYGMQKLLLLLLLINPVVRPVEVAVPALAGAEMTTLVAGGLTAIFEAIRRNNKHQPDDEKLVVKIPGTTIQATSVSVAGKSDEEVVDDLIGVVVAGLSKHHSLSVTDYELLDKHLRAKKQEFTKSLKEVRSIPRTETRYNLHRSTLEQLRLENRIAGEDMREGAINRFVRDNEIALSPENIGKTRETWKRVLTIFLDCNNPNIVRRIEARLSLQVLVDINSNVFGHQIREAALNLQARYFTDNKLTDFDYDMRLPETMRFFLQASPYFLNNNEKLQEFYDFVKEEGLDIAGNSVELMRQRDHGELTGDALKESWQQCKPETVWFKGKIFPHPDNSRAILSDLENWRIHRVAVLCEQGDFDGACDIANNATKIRPTMIKLINVCRREYCNEAGILKRYEHLPSWQSLPEPGKKHVGSNISAQTRMNKQLKAEAERLRTEAVARKEAELKADADSTQEEKPKSAVPTNPSSAEEMVSTPGPLPPEQDDPEKDKEQSSDSEKTYRDSLKNNNLKSNAIKEGLKERFKLTEKIEEHIFSKDHVDKGIFNLGKNEVDIVTKFINIILLADHKDLLKEGSNQIHTIINGHKVVIRFFIKEGEILMLNGFIETNANRIGNVFRLLVEEYL